MQQGILVLPLRDLAECLRILNNKSVATVAIYTFRRAAPLMWNDQAGSISSCIT